MLRCSESPCALTDAITLDAILSSLGHCARPLCCLSRCVTTLLSRISAMLRLP
ncbi:hypothetical protein BDV98DRAFT_557340 [Pterulicium gracile]|uniref:Uncharacterized protein n=1 Tax=Pterulicium gracile TaxID=1884261 RepID=A0A5C3R765_9AGAR|nr:hypothetical protein BDV98DRAFT_557340 [Pterula gracilis]